MTKRIHGELLKFSTDVRSVAVSKFGALNQQHENRFAVGIDPALRAPGAAVAESSRREHFRHLLRFADDAPSQAPTVPRCESRNEIPRLDAGHLADGFFRDDSHAI